MKPTIKCINGRWVVTYRLQYAGLSKRDWDEWKWAIYFLNELYKGGVLELNGSTL